MPFQTLSPLLSPPPVFLPSKTTIRPLLLPKLPFSNSRNHLQILSCASRNFSPQDSVLQSIAESNDRILPCVRTFENDPARLSLVGSVDFDQALTAASADGGQAAVQHISSGIPAMVVETVFPGPADEHATVSTRLFLPAKRVKEKARKLKKSFSKDIFDSETPQNILAMTFRQVVLQQLWNFELIVFQPGAVRDMHDLENSREVPASFFLGSSDESVLSILAEAVCIVALQNTERQFVDDFWGKFSLFNWFWKAKRRVVSRDSSVVIDKLFEDEIVENAESLLENFNSVKGSFKGRKLRQKYNWWMPLAHSRLEKIGGPVFSAWISEFVPAYRLEIDADKVKDIKFEGWRKCAENRWEVILTHSQMVGLAEVLDMYYEDTYSLPSKELLGSFLTNCTNLSNKKLSFSLMNILATTLASGVFLITLGALAQFRFPHVLRGLTYAIEHKSLQSSEIEHPDNESSEMAKLQEYCVRIVKKIKDAFGWPGDIVMGTNFVAWSGEVPDYLIMTGDGGEPSSEANSTYSSSPRKVDAERKSSAQDIASYEVALSTDGQIVGLQPTSSAGVHQWATNPLAKELYGESNLSPGFIDHDFKKGLPNEVVLIELLMSVNSDVHFALARPVR